MVINQNTMIEIKSVKMTDNKPGITSPEIPILTEKERKLRDLFRLSFRFSQGSTSAQGQIFKWLKIRGYLDEFEIDKEPPRFILDIRPPRKHPDKSVSGKIVDDDLITETLKYEWDELRKVKYPSTTKTQNDPSTILLLYLINKEAGYQKSGRPDDTSDGKYDSPIRNILVLNKPVEHVVYGHLFRDLSPIFNILRSKGSGELTVLKRIWEENHPREKFFPAERAA